MIKLIALYQTPDDPEAFMSHYTNVHTPLVRAIPGLENLIVNKVTSGVLPPTAETYLIAEMHFPDEETFSAAMRSEENRAAGKDLMSFARGKVSMVVTSEI